MSRTFSGREPLYRTPEPSDVEGAWFDEQAVERVVKFARFCRHTKGRWDGNPIEFLDWQLEQIVRPIFGWKHPDGTRIIRTAWIEVPKKNGKSTIATVLGLYLTGPDREPGAEVYAAAAAKDQARIVFDPARDMVEKSPSLSRNRRFKVFRNSISYAKTNSFFRVISADASVQEGLNPHGAIIDEVHVHPNRDLIDTLEDGVASRDQPLVFFITTAGSADDTSIYHEKHDYARKCAEGLLVDPSFWGVIYAAEAADDWRTQETWEKANPSFGVTIPLRFREEQVRKAEASPAKRNDILRKHLNLRTKQVIRWLPLEKWNAGEMVLDESALRDEPCYMAFDVSRSQDINTIVLDFPREDGVHVVLYRFFLPQDLLGELESATDGAATLWAERGHLTLTPGDVVDYSAIANRIRSDGRLFDMREIAFNRRGAAQLAQELEQEGFDLVEMTTGITLGPAMQEWERLLLAGKFRHEGNAVARYQFDGLVVRQNNEGVVWPDKGKSTVNVSGPVGTAMALARAVAHQESIYEERGLQTL